MPPSASKQSQDVERILRKKLKGGTFGNVTPVRSASMRAVRSSGNKSTELRFRMALVRRGIFGWVLHPRDMPGSPDVYFPISRLAVFLDGCFWHGCPRCGHVPQTNRGFWALKIQRNRERDRKKRRALRRLGISVVQFWEHQLQADVSRCVGRILSLIK